MESYDYIASRLKEERSRIGLNQIDLAAAAGVTRQTQSKYEKGMRCPDSIYLNAISLQGIDILYVVTGVRTVCYAKPADECADQQENNKLASLDGDNSPDPEEFVVIPFYTLTAKNDGLDIGGDRTVDTMIFNKEWIHRELHVNSEQLYLLYVEGESMTPKLNPGDVLLIDHADTTVMKDGIYALQMDDALLVKHLQRLPDRRIKVISDNPKYEPFELSLDRLGENIDIIGRVVWLGHRC